MSLEIERKFLVLGDDYRRQARCAQRIVQGYLSTDVARTVRVRIKGEQGFITIKGQSSQDGVSRFEWEQPLSLSDAEALLALCLPGVIDKVRYEVAVDGLVFEIDEFAGENQGLVVAEVELPSVDAAYPQPTWLGQEVSGKKRYYTSQLMQRPYAQWSQDERNGD